MAFLWAFMDSVRVNFTFTNVSVKLLLCHSTAPWGSVKFDEFSVSVSSLIVRWTRGWVSHTADLDVKPSHSAQ